MQVRVITMKYNEGQQGFSEEALRSATFGRDVLSCETHFFTHGGAPHLTLVLQLADASGFDADRPFKPRDPNAPNPEDALPEELRVGGRYLRYMDDLLIFADSKAECWHLANDIGTWLKRERVLELKSEATIVAPVSEGMPFLGLRIFAGSWRLKRGRFMRTRHTVAVKEAQWKSGIIGEERFAASVAAADGAARWFGFKGILNNLGNSENKVTEEGASSGSNRVNRGGSWNNNANNCRSAYRNNNYNPSNYNNNLGFRLSSTLPPRPGSAGSHSARPALRESEDEHARPAAAGSAARRERRGRGFFWRRQQRVERLSNAIDGSRERSSRRRSTAVGGNRIDGSRQHSTAIETRSCAA